MTRLPPVGPRAAALALLLAPLLHGTPVLYNDRATWAATSNLSAVITFSEAGLAVPAAPNFTISYNNAAGLTVGGLNFVGYLRVSTNAYALNRVAENASPNPFYDYDSGVALTSGQFVQTDYQTRIRINIPGGATSIGMDLASYFNNNGTLTVQLSTGDSFQVLTGTRPTLTFLGIVDQTTPFTWVDIYPNTVSNTGVLIDNVQFGNYAGAEPPHTPELTTVLYLLTGLLGIILALPKRKRG